MIVDKPWGRMITYALNQPASVRLVEIRGGQETAPHYHRLREELWVVLDEGIEVQVGNRTVVATPGEEFIVAAEEPHRMANRGEATGRVLEIAWGYTTEDDVLTVGAEQVDADW